MNDRTHVRQPKWEIDSFPGCCSCDIIYRLGGYYDSIIEYNVQGYSRDISFVKDNYEIIIPIEWAFTAVLHDMLQSDGRLFVATDRIKNSEYADMETGPFSTKLFIKWLDKNGLANVVQGPSSQGVSGWFLRMYVGKSKEQVDRINKLMKDYTPARAAA